MMHEPLTVGHVVYFAIGWLAFHILRAVFAVVAEARRGQFGGFGRMNK